MIFLSSKDRKVLFITNIVMTIISTVVIYGIVMDANFSQTLYIMLYSFAVFYITMATYGLIRLMFFSESKLDLEAKIRMIEEEIKEYHNI